MLFHGYFVDSSYDIIKVCCKVVNLNAFIKCSGDADICVRDDEGCQYFVKKQDVEWETVDGD